MRSYYIDKVALIDQFACIKVSFHLYDVSGGDSNRFSEIIEFPKCYLCNVLITGAYDIKGL